MQLTVLEAATPMSVVAALAGACPAPSPSGVWVGARAHGEITWGNRCTETGEGAALLASSNPVSRRTRVS